MPNFEWSEEAIATATKLAAERCTATEIANALGVSRNSVIGKLARIGVPLMSGQTRGETFWNSKRDAQLRKLWLDSSPAADIAKRMGLKGIATVSGRARFLQLPKRDTAKPPARPFAKPARAPVLAAAPLPPVEQVPAAPPPNGAVAFLDARPGHCRFPLWPDYSRVPLEQKFFCGETAGISSYCAHHAARCAGIGTASERRAMEQAA